LILEAVAIEMATKEAEVAVLVTKNEGDNP
jgi:hypothetical protein